MLLSCEGEGTIVVYVNWASKRNINRGARCLEACFWSRGPGQSLRKAADLSCALEREAELTAVCEGMKEGLGLFALIQHIYGLAAIPVVKSDLQAAINISSMYGLLRRIRRIDLRLCWVQETLRAACAAQVGARLGECCRQFHKEHNPEDQLWSPLGDAWDCREESTGV